MIQSERGLAAYHAANTIGRIKLTRDDRHSTVHKVADAQTPAWYVPSLTRDIRNAKGHYPGRDAIAHRYISRRPSSFREADHDLSIVSAAVTGEHLPEREREREREGDIYGI